MSKRLLSTITNKPIVYINSWLQSTNFSFKSVPNPNNINYQKQQNVYFKSKLLLLIGLVFLGSNLLLSSLIFNISNYNEFVEITKNLDLYLNLNKKFFQSKEFLSHFKIPSTHSYSFINENVAHHEFNQNYSISAYLSHINNVYEHEQNPEDYLKTHKIDFHWGDWVDLAPATPFVKTYKDILHKMGNNESEVYQFVRKMCYDKLYDAKDPWLDQETYEQKLFVSEHLQDIGICSAIYKYYYATIPERVVLETDFKYFEMPVNQVRRKDPFGLDGLSRIYYNTKNEVSSKQVENFNPNDRDILVDQLQQTYYGKGFKPEDLNLKPTLTQPQEDFKKPDVPALLKTYQDISNPSREEEKYTNFLKYSVENVGKADKFYFIFPFIQIDSKAELHHYNFPWIKHIISHEERIQVIHHLIRSWFKYAEHAHIVSWFNYGNLIGWYFNAQNLPWDNDVDVQVSIQDQDKIGRFHNNTLVIENPKLGDHLFWIQTNPYYMQQKDNQFIDARYIDVKTGIYIDISALWESERAKPKDIKPKEGEIAFHCKHYNWFVFSDIFPLRRTIYEGAQAYMPNNIEGILKRFYGNKAINNWNIFDHNWQPDIGLWVPNQICEMDLVPKTEDRFDSNGELTLFGACNNTDLLEEWRNAKPTYEIHKKEHEAIKKGEDSSKFSEKDLDVFRVFKHEDYR
ncbi:hypothetical protein BN7_5793 [Wickerhamomyces ciferrii]|uniref:LicD/FKTN/FKRP nucleotidyltransferase domain-containing protein n=1 Tax=Wickerhamomyces ciferrii (strain ATCC 14091 / BCRC 22168 / CBS 111 / JCM 3599 / NBRC 0793 / NRRL Y-1031 F-60-10) TaxID=1206466 RepID=K0KW46_WICCF|nr:uncharacterized protein BN7_5793 [Wickerhamomyces ciferrii]CCH46202.1 hypothetical protein BN7_5793 [Wickerhamomyces ciferrii]